jgi:hypothetical protein
VQKLWNVVEQNCFFLFLKTRESALQIFANNVFKKKIQIFFYNLKKKKSKKKNLKNFREIFFLLIFLAINVPQPIWGMPANFWGV